MKRLLFIGIIFMAASIYSVDAAETEHQSSFSQYRPCYMIFGDKNDQVKGQFSLKYGLLHPYKIGLFFGYTQYMFWDLYDISSPFRDINYNPEVFWKWKIQAKRAWLKLDYIQIGPYEHNSNGRGGEESRSWDRYYAQAQISVGDRVNAGINLKGFGFYYIGEHNEDIKDYIGHYEAKIFIKLTGTGKDEITDREEVYIRGGSGSVLEKGWLEAGFKIRTFFARFKPYIFVQIWHGYAESLLIYNEKETYIRAGFILE